MWTRLDTLPFSDGAVLGDFDATIAADGCLVVFRRSDTKMYVAERGTDGTFGAPVEIVSLEARFDPALAPSGQRLWAIDSSHLNIVDGTP